MVKLLQSDGAKQAKKIVAEYEPQFASKENHFDSCGDRIIYDEDGTATVKLD